MKICSNCGRQSVSAQNYCPKCGAELPAELPSVANVVMEIEAKSLEEARALLQPKLSTGIEVLSEKVLADGLPHTIRGIGTTNEGAYMKAAQEIPPDSVIIECKTIVQPKRSNISVDGMDKFEAWKSTEVLAKKAGANARIDGLAIKVQGKKGFLGLGKSASQFHAVLVEDAVVEVTYLQRAKVSFTVGRRIAGTAGTNEVESPFPPKDSVMDNWESLVFQPEVAVTNQVTLREMLRVTREFAARSSTSRTTSILSGSKPREQKPKHRIRDVVVTTFLLAVIAATIIFFPTYESQERQKFHENNTLLRSRSFDQEGNVTGSNFRFNNPSAARLMGFLGISPPLTIDLFESKAQPSIFTLRFAERDISISTVVIEAQSLPQSLRIQGRGVYWGNTVVGSALESNTLIRSFTPADFGGRDRLSKITFIQLSVGYWFIKIRRDWPMRRFWNESRTVQTGFVVR